MTLRECRDSPECIPQHGYRKRQKHLVTVLQPPVSSSGPTRNQFSGYRLWKLRTLLRGTSLFRE